ncbi:hypothetical protein ACFX15_038027 [Malus domestica]
MFCLLKVEDVMAATSMNMKKQQEAWTRGDEISRSLPTLKRVPERRQLQAPTGMKIALRSLTEEKTQRATQASRSFAKEKMVCKGKVGKN